MVKKLKLLFKLFIKIHVTLIPTTKYHVMKYILDHKKYACTYILFTILCS